MSQRTTATYHTTKLQLTVDGTDVAAPVNDNKNESKPEQNGSQTGIKPTSHTGESHRLLPQDEMKLLKNWGFMKKTLIIGHIVDPLIEKGVITPDHWMAMKRKASSDAEKVEEFLYYILKCKGDTYNVFLKALRLRGYSHVATQLEDSDTKANVSPSVTSTSGSGTSLQGRQQIGRPAASGKFIQQQYQTTPSLSTESHHGAASGGFFMTESGTHPEDTTVKQEDLNRVKEEITGELRQLRMNIENDRDQDRLELQLLKRKHTELHEDLTKATDDRTKLESELTCVTESVNELKSQMESKENEYREMRQQNKELRHQLESKSSDLQRLIQHKEREKAELARILQAKEVEYKKLQSTLETLKVDHEERHTRLKGVNREKCTLEKEVQLLHKEKKNLEVKIKSLEQHIRTLQETHARETGVMKQQLEKQKTLLEEKERERVDLENKLKESVKENENLKHRNQRLEESLEKNRDEKDHLQQKIKQQELNSYAIPPFYVGSKSTRVGWMPKNKSTNWR